MEHSKYKLIYNKELLYIILYLYEEFLMFLLLITMNQVDYFKIYILCKTQFLAFMFVILVLTWPFSICEEV